MHVKLLLKVEFLQVNCKQEALYMLNKGSNRQVHTGSCGVTFTWQPFLYI